MTMALKKEWPYKVPTDSEIAVVGVVLRNEGIDLPRVRCELEPEDFFTPEARDVYRVMLELQAHGAPIDLISVANNASQLGVANAHSLVAELIDTPAMQSSLEYHVDIVKRNSDARKVYGFCRKWISEAHAAPESDLISGLIADTSRLSNRRSGAITLSDMRHEHEAWLSGGDNHDFLVTGINHIDRLIRFQPDYLTIIGARPKVGKTSMVIDLAARFSRGGKPGLIFSLEMASSRLLRKLNARLCPHQDYLQRARHEAGFLTTFDLMSEHKEAAYSMPIRMIDSMHDIESIMSAVRSEKQQNPDLSYIAIDYVEMISTKARMNGPVETINHVMRSLVSLKKEVKVPIFLLSQLRRRNDEFSAEPSMDELKGSGLIEQSADVMMLLWEEKLNAEEITTIGDTYKKIKVKVIQRDGPDGIVPLRYYPPQALFGEWRTA